jgi:hypothetical protein
MPISCTEGNDGKDKPPERKKFDSRGKISAEKPGIGPGSLNVFMKIPSFSDALGPSMPSPWSG